MTDWVEKARQEHRSYSETLARALPSFSVPIGDSDYTAPGWLFLGEFYSCVPDAEYPWDPAVVRALREFCPDAIPIIIRSVWQWSNYGELGHLAEPIILKRHGLARSIRDPILPIHNFHCEMPCTPYPGLLIPGRDLADCRPNYIEVNWYDKEIRPHGFDLPGAYLPFDWEFFHSLRRCDEEFSYALRHSKRAIGPDGDPVATGLAQSLISPYKARLEERKKARAAEHGYIMRDIERYHSVQPSDVEWKEAALSQGATP